jgi:hypothetical protein
LLGRKVNYAGAVRGNISGAQAGSTSGNNLSSSAKLDFIQPCVENGRVVVKPPRGIAVEGSSVWKKTLVGHFVGPKLSYSAAVNPIAFKLWGKWGFNLVGVLSSENGFYFFKFSSEEHLLSVLDRAPWHMANRPLVLKRWHPTLSFQSSSTPSPVVTQRGITENSFMG